MASVCSIPWRPKHEDAWGAQFVRRGFAITPADDLAFALGWPFVVVLDRTRPEDPDALLDQLYRSGTPRVVPRAIASRFARLLDRAVVGQPPPDVSAGRLGVAEAKRIVERRMASSYPGVKDGALYPLLEALVGSEPIARVIVASLEGYETKDLEAWNRAAIHALRWLGLGLLRCRKEVGSELVARLEKVSERWATLDLDPKTQLLGLLDLVLHGASGARRSGHVYGGVVSPFDLVFTHDDASFVTDCFEKTTIDSLWVPNVRLAFLGTERVVARVADNWRKIRDREDLARTVRDFSSVRSAHVERLLREVAETSSGAGPLARSLLENGEA